MTTEEEARAVERLSRRLDEVLFDGAPSGQVVAGALAIVVANHVHQQPEPKRAYALFGRMVQDMVKLLQKDVARQEARGRGH